MGDEESAETPGEYPEQVQLILQVLDDMKAMDVEVYHVSGKTVITDYFIICSGSSNTHTSSIADEVYLKCKGRGWQLGRMEGHDNPSWKILDYGDCVVHVFLPETRDFYKLEEIWGEARKQANIAEEDPIIQRLKPGGKTGPGATAELKKRRAERQ